MSSPAQIIQHNADLRQIDGIRNTDGLRWALSIPFKHHARLVKANPALVSKDAKERSNAWLAFMRSPVSLPYRVREKI